MTYYTIKSHLETEATRVEDYASAPSEKQINLLAFLMNSKGINELEEVPLGSGLTKRQTSRLIDQIKDEPDLTIEQVQERTRQADHEEQKRKELADRRAGAKMAQKDENRDAFADSEIASVKVGTQFTAKIKHDFYDRIDTFVGTIDRREPRKGRVRVAGELTNPDGEAKQYRHNIEAGRITDIVLQ